MNNAPDSKYFLIRLFNEITLYSGQYALFYLIMQFSMDRGNFWLNEGHVALLFALAVQTAALACYGHNIISRIVFSFLSLTVYTLFELFEGGFSYSLLNAGHLLFWAYTVLFAVLQFISHRTKHQNIRMIVEFVESNINMMVFIFVYFFFDFRLMLQKEVLAGKISADFADHQLLVWNFIPKLGTLFQDPAHVYILLGSVFLSFTIAYGRIRIVLLSEKIDSLLVRYIGEETRNELVGNASGVTSRRIATTVLYSDIRNFTSLSEKNDASDVVSMLNFYYGIWHETIKAFHGTINKFIGDALLSYFDSRTSLAENAALAVQAALSMLQQQARIRQELTSLGLPAFECIGIGIHCGEVILGDIGGERKDYTLIGDTVNTAARLESMCKEHMTPLIVSEACYLLLDDVLKQRFTALCSMTLRGKKESILLYGLKIS